MLKDDLLIQLSAYCDGELDATSGARIEIALASQPELQAELKAFQTLHEAVAMLPLPQVDTKLAALWENNAARITSRHHPSLNGGAVAIRAPQISSKRFEHAWTKISSRTVVPSMDDAARMQRSAFHDGEMWVPPIQGDAALSENQENADRAAWAALDRAATYIPIPVLPELCYRETWHEIAVRTLNVKAADRQAFERLDAAISELPVPEMSAAASERVRTALAVRTQITLETAAPAIGPERWGKVWSGIATKTSLPLSSRQAAHAQTLDSSSKISPLPLRHEPIRSLPGGVRPGRIGWRVMAAAALAACVILAFVFSQPRGTVEPELAAIDMPQALDERYQVQVRYPEGNADPVVCVFLKDATAAQEPDTWRWLPD